VRAIPLNVRYRGKARQQSLSPSFSAFDPKRASTIKMFCVARFAFDDFVGPAEKREWESEADGVAFDYEANH